jgi:hypothetical protein
MFEYLSNKIPQCIYIVLTILSLVISLIKHGEPRTGNENFITSFITIAIIYWILIAGGFFN